MLAIPNQVKEQVEDLGFDRHQRRPATQFAAIRIERVIFKKITHVANPTRAYRPTENNTASCAKIKETVSAR